MKPKPWKQKQLRFYLEHLQILIKDFSRSDQKLRSHLYARYLNLKLRCLREVLRDS